VIATINPATNEKLRVFDPLSEAELDAMSGVTGPYLHTSMPSRKRVAFEVSLAPMRFERESRDSSQECPPRAGRLATVMDPPINCGKRSFTFHSPLAIGVKRGNGIACL
jgi:hypothetical protein